LKTNSSYLEISRLLHLAWILSPAATDIDPKITNHNQSLTNESQAWSTPLPAHDYTVSDKPIKSASNPILTTQLYQTNAPNNQTTSCQPLMSLHTNDNQQSTNLRSPSTVLLMSFYVLRPHQLKHFNTVSRRPCYYKEAHHQPPTYLILPREKTPHHYQQTNSSTMTNNINSSTPPMTTTSPTNNNPTTTDLTSEFDTEQIELS